MLKVISSMLFTSKIHAFSHGNYLEFTYHGNVMRIKVTIDELVDVALGTNSAQDFDLNVDLDLVDVDDVVAPAIKLNDAKRHPSLLFSFLLKNSLYVGVHEIISFQKLVGNLGKMMIANLGKQHNRSLDS